MRQTASSERDEKYTHSCIGASIEQEAKTSISMCTPVEADKHATPLTKTRKRADAHTTDTKAQHPLELATDRAHSRFALVDITDWEHGVGDTLEEQ